MRARIILATLLLAGVTNSKAASADMLVTGPADMSCARYAQEYKDHTDVLSSVVYTWAMGFMSGMNFDAIGGPKPLKNLSLIVTNGEDHFISKLNSFCDQNPLKEVMQFTFYWYLNLPDSKQKKL